MKLLYLFIIMSYLTGLYSESLQENKLQLASYFVKVDYQDKNVKLNLHKAVQKLNGSILVPGEIFSFNNKVGEGSAKNGYRPARVYFQNMVVLEPGGGLCVVSTSLYNLFLISGFNIIERHRHSKPVQYVPVGLDATIRYGLKDLKVINPYSMPITLGVDLTDDRFSVRLYGDKKLPFSYEIATEEEEDPYPFRIPGKEVVSGVSVSVYRKKFNLSGQLLEAKLLYTDYFPPMYK